MSGYLRSEPDRFLTVSEIEHATAPGLTATSALSDVGLNDSVAWIQAKTGVNCRPKRPQKQAQIATKLSRFKPDNSM